MKKIIIVLSNCDKIKAKKINQYLVNDNKLFRWESDNDLIVLIEDEEDVMDINHEISLICYCNTICVDICDKILQEEIDLCENSDTYLCGVNESYWGKLVNNPILFCDAFKDEFFDLYHKDNGMYCITFRYNESLKIQGHLTSRVKEQFESIGFIFELKTQWIEATLGSINVTLTWE